MDIFLIGIISYLMGSIPFGEDAKAALQAILERKTRQAEDKIGQAEAQLSQEIRAVAAELAISAAGKLISENLTTEAADKILDSSIKNVSSHLN